MNKAEADSFGNFEALINICAMGSNIKCIIWF